MTICTECAKELQIGDYPFCQGNPTDHTSVNGRHAEWGDAQSVVVFKKPDGTFSYPARNDKETPSGYERITLRSLRAVERFEKQAGVLNHAMHYDNNGRAIDDSFRGNDYK